ncbi:MAG: pilus assembly PilX N-terminal domain-containing protein [Myxococcota bacterium]|nr:pilus assembly PilX N-terminal domain-containing protein [Myxococcota bacterium]
MKGMRTTTALRRTMKKRQGAALVAVLLLTMVLSGIGLLAVQNTFNSMQLAGNHRLRRQALETANAGLLYVSAEVSANPGSYYKRMAKEPALDPDNFEFTKDYVQTNLLTTTGNSTGLFEDPNDPSVKSFEGDESLGTIDFDVLIRDSTDGPPPPGSQQNSSYGEAAFCTKQVFLASRSRYDALERNAGLQTEGNWDRPARAASSMVGMGAWMGPIPCNNSSGD